MNVQDLVLNLEAAGFEADRIEEYLVCWRMGDIKEQLTLLSRHGPSYWIASTGRKSRLTAWIICSIRLEKAECQPSLRTDVVQEGRGTL